MDLLFLKQHTRCSRPHSLLVCCGYYSQRRNQATLGGVENSDFNFYLAGPDVYQCLSPEQRIHRIFKRQSRVSGYKECALP
jgi:hypothetical protein